ncbi:cyclophane-containing peptide 2OG-Fe(II) oxygenase YhhC [Massilia scottii]|uniref:cyclophane-containing peptide 2OG-Fe(II) oxygenase YhhC n=1 Tax=Massilia scottii TaxID=3057166 RepID=UPI002796BEFE|nr:cyclophane-containing peptide 2OG-Fe(II) oxygenase YhhC [Massilia sp. CCM 9029]MDQ1833644.1 cyclophane-containing peptide 2OG-Fe(II) oxygenase YhhC [Massilia sp. CCM 9029]
MSPAELAERLVPGETARAPFPHFFRDGTLPERLAENLLAWMETGARWRLHTASFFEQYELDLTATSMPEECRILFAPETLAAITTRYASAFKRKMSGRASVTAHKLVSGQTIGIHTDEPLGERETHRLLVQLNRGWKPERGGELLLLAGNDIGALHSVIEPAHNRAVGFEMSERSFHAVARVNDWARYTVIFSFWADDRPSPAMTRHVAMPQREQVLAFLRQQGAATVPHSDGSFLDHLKGVERILDRWGAPLEVRLAGLLHSVYGTEGFATTATVEPAQVEALVGPAAAQLVALFCGMTPASLVDSVAAHHPALCKRDGSALGAAQDQLDALLLMYLANMAEQLPRLRHLQEVVDDDRAIYRRIRAYVPAPVRAELDALFERLGADRGEAHADSAIAALRLYIGDGGGDEMLRGHTTLLGHLSGMEGWLAAQGAQAEVRVAAFAQGLYGWKADLSEQNRAIVRVVAGEAAERLAWLFAACDDAALAKAEAEAEGAFGLAHDTDQGILELAGVNGRREPVTRCELACLALLARAEREAI